jgi:1-acyl-sn-glycerol-3-phosphate acyltransferase
LSLWVILLLVLLVVLAVLVFRVVQRHHRTDYGNSTLNWLEGLNRLFCHQYHRLECDSLELPDSGPAVVVSNHLSGLDAMLLIAASPRPLRFMIAREQYNIPVLKTLFKAIGCIPVDRSGKPEKAMRAAIDALEQGEVVALFPHGKIHLPSDPPRKLKGGAARLAMHTNCEIHPALIDGIVGQGHVLPAVIMRGHARLRILPVIDPEGKSYQELMEIMQEMLDAS